jgi:hypothetical protein
MFKGLPLKIQIISLSKKVKVRFDKICKQVFQVKFLFHQHVEVFLICEMIL